MESLPGTSAHAAKVAELQSTLRTKPALQLELLACISRLFREHGVPLAPEVLANLTLTMHGVHTSAAHAGGPPPAPPPRSKITQALTRLSINGRAL